MKRVPFTLLILLASLVYAVEAQALPFRTFVSIAGVDANDCTLKTPCRTFFGAAPKTAAGGEITAVDSGTYGRVTINKALTIQAAPGVYALLASTFGANPVTVSAGGGDIVVLRNLYISQMSKTGKNVPTKGIELISAFAVHVESCVVTGFAEAGLFRSGSFDIPEILLFVKDSIFRENGGAGLTIERVTASLDHCRIERNHDGIIFQVFSKVTIRDSVIAGNLHIGLNAEAGASSTNVENTIVTNNGTGISAGLSGFGGAKLYVSTSMIVSNQTGLAASGMLGTMIISFGNNRLANNVTDGAFTSTIAQQ